MIPRLQRLARKIGRRWSAVGRRLSAFPSIAEDALFTAREEIVAEEIVEYVVTGGRLPRQTSLEQAFGQPPVTLVRASQFYVEALFWHTATTGIHEHRFRGAFLVVSGSSLHAKYRFVPRSRTRSVLELGALSLDKVELLKRGDVRAIPFGGELTHALFHLDMPSVTLVARTFATPGPEYEYRPPGIALDPRARSPKLIKQLHLLEMLRISEQESYVVAACRSITASARYESFVLLCRASLHLAAAELRQVEAAFRMRHPHDAAHFIAAAREERRKSTIIHARSLVADPELRFAMALLLNLSSRRAILAAAKQRNPNEDPEVQLGRWRDALTCVLEDADAVLGVLDPPSRRVRRGQAV